MPLDENSPVHSAAIIKMTFILKKMDKREFKAIYKDLLADLGVSGKSVDKYIKENRMELETLCKEKGLG